jgi:hypothetical protein
MFLSSRSRRAAALATGGYNGNRSLQLLINQALRLTPQKLLDRNRSGSVMFSKDYDDSRVNILCRMCEAGVELGSVTSSSFVRNAADLLREIGDAEQCPGEDWLRLARLFSQESVPDTPRTAVEELGFVHRRVMQHILGSLPHSRPSFASSVLQLIASSPNAFGDPVALNVVVKQLLNQVDGLDSRNLQDTWRSLSLLSTTSPMVIELGQRVFDRIATAEHWGCLTLWGRLAFLVQCVQLSRVHSLGELLGDERSPFRVRISGPQVWKDGGKSTTRSRTLTELIRSMDLTRLNSSQVLTLLRVATVTATFDVCANARHTSLLPPILDALEQRATFNAPGEAKLPIAVDIVRIARLELDKCRTAGMDGSLWERVVDVAERLIQSVSSSTSLVPAVESASVAQLVMLSRGAADAPDVTLDLTLTRLQALIAHSEIDLRTAITVLRNASRLAPKRTTPERRQVVREVVESLLKRSIAIQVGAETAAAGTDPLDRVGVSIQLLKCLITSHRTVDIEPLREKYAGWLTDSDVGHIFEISPELTKALLLHSAEATSLRFENICHLTILACVLRVEPEQLGPLIHRLSEVSGRTFSGLVLISRCAASLGCNDERTWRTLQKCFSALPPTKLKHVQLACTAKSLEEAVGRLSGCLQ